MIDPSATGSAFHIDGTTVRARIAPAQELRSIPLFQHGTLLVKYYAPRDTDVQTPHARDEVYVVAHGRGTFFDGSSRRAVQPGDLLFVAAGITHRFESFSEDFGVWVMFYGPEGGEAP